MNPDLLLWQSPPLSVYYAPWDRVNTAARVMLVGITPGLYQATEARRCLAQGLSDEEALRSTDAGPSLGLCVPISSICSTVSGLRVRSGWTAPLPFRYPSSPGRPCVRYRLSRVRERPELRGQESLPGQAPALRSFVRSCLGARVAMASGALVIPLGTAVQEAVTLLVADGLLDPRRCLAGFPHPSGGNGHRESQYASRREALSKSVAQWAVNQQSTPVLHDTEPR